MLLADKFKEKMKHCLPYDVREMEILMFTLVCFIMHDTVSFT